MAFPSQGRLRAPVVGAVTVAVLVAALAFFIPAASAASTVSASPVADAYATSASPTANTGTQTQLRIDGSPLVRSYLRFDLRSVTGSVTSAKLHVHANSASTAGYDVDTTDGASWTETGLTWSNAPALGSVAGTAAGFAAGTSTTVDVTSVVRAGSVVDLALVARDGTAVSFGSRESANPPVLVLTLSSVNVAAAADSYVDSSQPSVNFGTATQVRVDGSPVVRSLLRFDLRGLAGSVSSAKLQIYANSASTGGLVAARTSGAAWTETGVTWANAPALGSNLASVASVTTATTISLDVTPAVTTGGLVDLAVYTNGATAISLASRESAHPPILSLTLSGNASIVPTNAVTPAPTGNATPKPTATPAATPASTPTPVPSSSSGDPQLIAAGDVRTNLSGIQATTALIVARPGLPVLNVGDDTADGSASLYQSYFNPNWGQFKSRIHPTPGNHEYNTSGAGPYFAYYGAAAGSSSKSWYSFDLANNWHVIELNGNVAHGVGSAQEVWLKSDLAANPGKHIIAFWHQPRFSSGAEHGSDTGYTPFWNDLYAAHADIVLNGHDHDYERFALQNGAGQADPNGIREWVVGMGGAPLYSFGSIVANSQARISGTYGILVLTLHAHSYDWQFVPQSGKTATDSGTQATHS